MIRPPNTQQKHFSKAFQASQALPAASPWYPAPSPPLARGAGRMLMQSNCWAAAGLGRAFPIRGFLYSCTS